MDRSPSTLSKIFGSGPAGSVLSILLLVAAFRVDRWLRPPRLSDNVMLLNGVLIVSIVLTFALVAWSVRSLPASQRGNRLVTEGAFRFVRHPLYAAFLWIFNFGLAVRLNSPVFLAWAVAVHPVWHFVIRYEERLMVDLFGQDYVEYRRRTGRFFPKLRVRRDGS